MVFEKTALLRESEFVQLIPINSGMSVDDDELPCPPSSKKKFLTLSLNEYKS